MISYSPRADSTALPESRPRPSLLTGWRLAVKGYRFISLFLLIVPVLYLLTLARTLVLGDPTEFTFVANILGIAHPPGYAFITLAGKLFQTLVPIGSIPWRMHALSATAATLTTFLAYGAVLKVADRSPCGARPRYGPVAAVFAALTIGTAADFWQHAIHTNPHIITATFLAANLFFLTRWWANPEKRTGWLLAFCVSAGLGITHHPLTVFSVPAYGIFILRVRPSILKEGRLLLKMAAFALLGLSVWLYFPIRSPMEPPFGPSTMNTLDGFLDHVLARGLTESLPFYSLSEQPARVIVFWTLLRLQYSLPVILLSLLGVGWLLRKERRPLLLLYGTALVCNYAFVISLRAQDIMAYLLGPFVIIGLLAGMGALGLFTLLSSWGGIGEEGRAWPVVSLSLFILLWPFFQGMKNAPLISLRDYDEGQRYLDAVNRTFSAANQGATLLNDWEHMTPIWYMRFVEGTWPDPTDVRPEFVSAGRTWLENVFDYLPGGPVFLSNYRRDVVDAGFRLRPIGPFFQVVEPGDRSVPAGLMPLESVQGDVEVIAYSLPQREVTAGDFVPLVLAMRSPQGTGDYYVPQLAVGDLTFQFTTDSHVTSPEWEPGEVIVERFDFALPHQITTGRYPVTLDLRNLSADKLMGLNLSLGQLQVEGREDQVETEQLLANFRQRVGLVDAVASGPNSRVHGPWSEPIRARPGDLISLTLEWRSLARAEESYTVFVHLIDLANRPVIDTLDYTPLGGASPTHLWIPKWLPGQQMLDPYRMHIPPDIQPGHYQIEVGMYEMVSRRRLHISDEDGNLIGDRFILGDVIVDAVP